LVSISWFSCSVVWSRPWWATPSLKCIPECKFNYFTFLLYTKYFSYSHCLYFFYRFLQITSLLFLLHGMHFIFHLHSFYVIVLLNILSSSTFSLFLKYNFILWFILILSSILCIIIQFEWFGWMKLFKWLCLPGWFVYCECGGDDGHLLFWIVNLIEIFYYVTVIGKNC